MQNKMIASNFSKSTISGYIFGAKQLADYCNRSFESIDSENVYSFLVYLKEERGLSRNTMRIAACGIKYLYRHILKNDTLVGDIPYPKQEKYLPEILTGEELRKMFDRTENCKHRAFLKLVYSSGLRREEACSLLITDIDNKNMQVRVRKAKGKKQRYTILSTDCLNELRLYLKKHRPQHYLFRGKQNGVPLSGNSTRWIMDRAKERAGITKKVSLHNLRHSFASHLLSMGTNLLTIKQLLGHEDIRTTMIYLHVQDLKQSQVISPLDLIYPDKK